MKSAVKIVVLAVLLLAVIPALAQESGQVRLFAHRGQVGRAPENSLAGIKACLKLGLDGAEIDLRATSDGHLVLLHDENLARTTDGKGRVDETTLEKLEGYRLKDKSGASTDQKVPTFAEVLDLIGPYPDFELVLDVKNVNIEDAAGAILKRGLADRVSFFIPDPQMVELAERIKAIDPRLKIGVDLLTWWKIEGLPTFAARALHADALFASEWFFPRCGFQEAREAGAEVQVYLYDGENLAERTVRAAELGAQVISVDRPALVLPALVEAGFKVKPE